MRASHAGGNGGSALDSPSPNILLVRIIPPAAPRSGIEGKRVLVICTTSSSNNSRVAEEPTAASPSCTISVVRTSGTNSEAAAAAPSVAKCDGAGEEGGVLV